MRSNLPPLARLVYILVLLAAAFGMAEADLPDFPFTEIDPLLVPRSNPIDPVN